MLFGGRASFLPTSVDRTARLLHGGCSRSTHSSRATASTTRGAATSRSRSTACPMSGGGRRDVRDGLLRHGGGDVNWLGTRAAGGWRGDEAPGAARAAVPARAGAVRGPAVVPAVRRRVVPAPRPARRPQAQRYGGDVVTMPAFPEPAGTPSFEIRGAEDRDGVLVRDVLIDGSIEAYLVERTVVDARTSAPGLVFAHWFDTNAPNGNRTQFVDEAVAWVDDHGGSAVLPQLDLPVGRRPDRFGGRPGADRRRRLAAAPLRRPGGRPAWRRRLTDRRRRARLRRDARDRPRNGRPAAPRLCSYRLRPALGRLVPAVLADRGGPASTTSGRCGRSTRSSTSAGSPRPRSSSSSDGATSSSPR